jgi:hypothetical protein
MRKVRGVHGEEPEVNFLLGWLFFFLSHMDNVILELIPSVSVKGKV